jgi:predicted hotdog family 3-hydroxylacyl-ACP dehydratase
MTLPVTGQNLIDLLPQKPPFVFVSVLLEVSESHSITSFLFDDKQVLCNNGMLSEGGLIENMAQTAATKTGYLNAVKGTKPPIGFIGDVRDFICSRLPKVGEEIVTEIRVTNEIFDVTIVSGTVKLNGEQIASCKMKIFEQPDKQTQGV